MYWFGIQCTNSFIGLSVSEVKGGGEETPNSCGTVTNLGVSSKHGIAVSVHRAVLDRRNRETDIQSETFNYVPGIRTNALRQGASARTNRTGWWSSLVMTPP